MTRWVFARAGKWASGTARSLWDRYRFGHGRGDYYDYLASLLGGMDGSRTLKDVFFHDALRHGKTSLRGRLSRQWLEIYQRAGGDLYATWEHHMPHAELALIRAAQSQGNQALVKTLHELSSVFRLLQRAARILSATLWPAVVAIFVATIVSLAVPGFTLPRLMDTFDGVPPDHYGTLTRRLIGFSGFIADYWLGILLFIATLIGFVMVSLPQATGPVRRVLDRFLWWKVYRNISALRFLAFLGISLGDDDFGSVQLRSALLSLRTGASVWLSSHIDDMLARLERGVAGPQTFDTGLFTREQYWFLSDMILARGLAIGLSLARDRIQRQVLRVVERQAVVMRWSILLACVAYVLGLVLWHYAVIDELRRALTFYLAS